MKVKQFHFSLIYKVQNTVYKFIKLRKQLHGMTENLEQE